MNHTNTKHNMVSVIIPCFLQGKFLSEAITSLQQQTHSNWEAIIIDDGSTDGTQSISEKLAKFDSRIRYVSQHRKGVSFARNTGLRISKGKYIQFLDADDKLDSGKFEKQIEFLDNTPEIDIVYGNAHYFYDNAIDEQNFYPFMPPSNRDWLKEGWEDPRPILEKFVESNLMPICAPLLRRRVITRAGLFDESITVLEDWEYWIRCLATGSTLHYYPMDGSDSFIRVHSRSASQDRIRMHQAEYEFRVACHQFIAPCRARSINQFKILNLCHQADKYDRMKRYSNIRLSCQSWHERLLVEIRNLIDPGGALNFLVKHVTLHLPGRVCRKLYENGLVSYHSYLENKRHYIGQHYQNDHT